MAMKSNLNDYAKYMNQLYNIADHDGNKKLRAYWSIYFNPSF